MIDEENQPDLTNVVVCSYQNRLYPDLTLDNCGTSNCTNKLKNICQQNIDKAQNNGQFESVFDLRVSCSECIVELQEKGLFTSSEEDAECESDE